MSVLVDAGRLAVGTLTRLPVRPPRRVDRSVGAWAMVLAPVATLPLAALAGGTVWLGDTLGLPPLLTAVLAVAALAAGTGGLHLDGLADTADGLAAPGDRERRLAVMRSGDVGPVGAVVLLLVVLVQVAALAGLVAARGASAALAVAVAVAAGRAALPVACARGVPAARSDGLGSAVAGSVPVPAAVAVVAGVTAVAGLVEGRPGVAGVGLALVAAGLLVLRAHRRLGGVTGDVLGACVELAVAAYLVAQLVEPGGLA